MSKRQHSPLPSGNSIWLLSCLGNLQIPSYSSVSSSFASLRTISPNVLPPFPPWPSTEWSRFPQCFDCLSLFLRNFKNYCDISSLQPSGNLFLPLTSRLSNWRHSPPNCLSQHPQIRVSFLSFPPPQTLASPAGLESKPTTPADPSLHLPQSVQNFTLFPALLLSQTSCTTTKPEYLM